jgi:hypothetical protein
MRKTAITTPGTSEQGAPALKAPQSIVHIKHKISLQQYKYWVLLLQELRHQLEEGAQPDEEGFYAMPMASLAGAIGYTPNKSELWNDLLALKNETIAFNVLNKDKEKEKYGAGFISEWKVSNSFIRFKFPSFLENVMRGLDDPKAMFALINWNVFNHFTGKYEAIIYKLCKDYVGAPTKRTPDMTLQQFREYMGLKDTEYQQFEDLNKRCIKGAVKAINESDVSDIKVTPNLYRSGRKVIGLYFSVEHKNQSSLQFPDLEEESVFKFAKVPITLKLQQDYLKIRPQEQIALCIQRANEYGEGLERAGKVATYGAIYRQAIKEGWHVQQAIKNANKATKTAVKKAEADQASDQDERNKRDQEEKAKAWAMFQALPDAEKKAMDEAFLKEAKDVDAKLFQKRGRESSPFKIFVRRQLLK